MRGSQGLKVCLNTLDENIFALTQIFCGNATKNQKYFFYSQI